MRHQKAGRKLGRDSAHRKALYSNLTGALIEHGRIRTTEAKAKEVRPIAEKMITLGKRGDLHAHRQAVAFLRSKSVAHKLFAEVAPRFAERPGGYTRVVKLDPRQGDNAPMAYLELVDYVPEQAVPAGPELAGVRRSGEALAEHVVPALVVAGVHLSPPGRRGAPSPCGRGRRAFRSPSGVNVTSRSCALVRRVARDARCTRSAREAPRPSRCPSRARRRRSCARRSGRPRAARSPPCSTCSSPIECVASGHQSAIPAVKTSKARSGVAFTVMDLRSYELTCRLHRLLLRLRVSAAALNAASASSQNPFT